MAYEIPNSIQPAINEATMRAQVLSLVREALHRLKLHHGPPQLGQRQL